MIQFVYACVISFSFDLPILHAVMFTITTGQQR